MKILSIGTGVIGTTYLWKFAEAGHEARVLVRAGKEHSISDSGIQINYVDKHNRKRITGTECFQPAVFSPQNIPDDNDIVIVSVHSHQLDQVLEMISALNTGTVFILQNTWKCRETVNRYLHPDRYILGFPHMVGGTNRGGEIDTIIFDDGHTRIESADSDHKKKLIQPLLGLLQTAGLKPRPTRAIENWIISHHIQQASGIGLFLKYGGPENVLADKARVSEMILTAREGLRVCRKMGMRPLFISPINILYIPLFILVPLFRKMFSAEDEMSMLRGHYEHGKYEMMHGWSEVLETGRKLNVKMPRWESFEEVIKEAMAGSCEVVHNNN